jgi:hypothetical protein
MNEMQEQRLIFVIKPKHNGIVGDAWAMKLIPSQCVMYLVGVLVQL